LVAVQGGGHTCQVGGGGDERLEPVSEVFASGGAAQVDKTPGGSGGHGDELQLAGGCPQRDHVGGARRELGY
jgi:hypothetical protein